METDRTARNAGSPNKKKRQGLSGQDLKKDMEHPHPDLEKDEERPHSDQAPVSSESPVDTASESKPFDFGGLPDRNLKKNLGCG